MLHRHGPCRPLLLTAGVQNLFAIASEALTRKILSDGKNLGRGILKGGGLSWMWGDGTGDGD